MQKYWHNNQILIPLVKLDHKFQDKKWTAQNKQNLKHIDFTVQYNNFPKLKISSITL